MFDSGFRGRWADKGARCALAAFILPGGTAQTRAAWSISFLAPEGSLWSGRGEDQECAH
jgi:hypothetical protein